METQTQAETPQMVVKDGVLKIQDLPQVMVEFMKELPPEALQESKALETQKGYDTLGYGYAWISERLNKVVGFCWRMVESNEVIREVKSSSGKQMYEASVDIVIQLGNWKNKEIESFFEVEPLTKSDDIGKAATVKNGINYRIERVFQVLAETPVGNGWHKAFSLADAKKGAKTNGFKKAAGFFGIGNEAYKKSIDEENMEVREVLSRKRNKKKVQTAQGQAVVAQANKEILEIHQRLEAMGAKTPEEKLSILANRCNFTAKSIDTLNPKQTKMVLALLMRS